MRFEQAWKGWSEGRSSQFEAAQPLGMSQRNFRRYCRRFEEEGLDGLSDRCLEQVSDRRAPVDEVPAVQERCHSRYAGWNVKHFHAWCRREGGTRSHSWVKGRLHEGALLARAPGRGKCRERAAWPGMLLHQDGSTHQWVPGCQWDLIVTMDEATTEHCSMFFVEQEGAASGFQGIRRRDCCPRLVLQPVHRPGQPLLEHARGGRQGGQGQPDPGGPDDEAAGYRDDCGAFARSPGPQRTDVRHASGAPGQRAGAV